MKILHLSDSHFDERGRLDDVIAVHRNIVEIAAGHDVDLIVHAGDWFERRSTPKERNAVVEFLLAATRIAPVFGVKGNHDQAGDLDIFNQLDTDNPVTIVDRPPVTPFGAHRIGTFSCIGLPWFDKAQFVAGVDATFDAETTRRMVIQGARDLLDSLRMIALDELEAGFTPILVGHVMVGGSLVSTGQCLIGTTVELAPSDIHGVGASYAALGHVHRAQEWHGGTVAYSGSPHRCNFGEPEEKGVRIVEFDKDAAMISNTFVPVAARKMVLLEDEWPGSVNRKPVDVKDALVRLRITVPVERAAEVNASMLEAKLIELGAAEAVVEIVTTSETRARAPEIVTKATLTEKVAVYLDSKGLAQEPNERARVMNKVATLEAL